MDSIKAPLSTCHLHIINEGGIIFTKKWSANEFGCKSQQAISKAMCSDHGVEFQSTHSEFQSFKDVGDIYSLEVRFKAEGTKGARVNCAANMIKGYLFYDAFIHCHLYQFKLSKRPISNSTLDFISFQNIVQ